MAPTNRCLDAHREHLRQDHLDAVAGTVVHELGHRSGPDGADETCCVTKGIEHVFVSIKDFLVAPDPDCKPTRLGSLGSAAHRIAATDLGLSAHLVPALRCGVAEASRMSCTTSL